MTTDPQELEGIRLTEHINDLNARVIRGEQIPPEEIRAALLQLRARRPQANSNARTTKKKKAADAAAAKLPDNLADLFKKPAGDKVQAEPKPQADSAQSKFDFNFLTKEV